MMLGVRELVTPYAFVCTTLQVRLCTNRTEAEVDALLGAANRYDSLSEATNGNCSCVFEQ